MILGGAPCAHTLAGGPLVCVRPDVHDSGHVFESTSGVPDAPKEEL